MIEATAERLGDLAERDAPLGAAHHLPGRRAGRPARRASTTTTACGAVADGGGRHRRRRASWSARAATSSSPTPGSPGWRSCWASASPAIEVDGTDVRGRAPRRRCPVVARRTVAAGLTGFEWAVGVPGSIGGAVRMNAGGHGSDMAAVLVGVRVVDLRSGEDGWVPAPPLDLGYRRSAVQPHQLVRGRRAGASRRATSSAAPPSWPRSWPGGAPTSRAAPTPARCSPTRRATPPAASSTRPGGKGRRHGTAEVSTKHANFIQADEGGRAADVLALMGEVQDARPRPRRRASSHPETRLVGFDRRPST